MWRSLVPLLQAAAIFLIVTDRKLLKQLRNQSTTDPTSAVAAATGNAVARWRLQRMIDGGAVKMLPDGRCYLDTDGYQGYRCRRITRAVVVFVVLSALVLGYMWLRA